MPENAIVGTGEALNEHVLGDRWPSAEERLEMLEEAVQVIRDLLTGKLITHSGRHYTVDTARLYSVPDQPPPHLPVRIRRQGYPAGRAHRRRLHVRAAEP
jgi:alkanesulfonate monooxygenase SsuD/methylene tetrahydromethanopterin reductase-like flavin-dependent oxidoreductase (luciferase family)